MKLFPLITNKQYSKLNIRFLVGNKRNITLNTISLKALTAINKGLNKDYYITIMIFSDTWK
jgi:hypothetical protein